MSAPQPACATAAPPIAPTRAWEELVGRPTYHVITSQAIAPSSPATMTLFVKTCGCTRSVAIVAAILVPKIRNAAKLKNAAHATARRGESTRVETTVAMEFAASWNPLKKSKPSATATMRTTSRVIRRSRLFQGDRFNDVGDVFAAIHRGLHLPQQVLPSQDVHRAVVPRVQLRHAHAVDPISLPLQTLDVRPRSLDASEILETPHGTGHRAGGPNEDLRLLAELRDRFLDAVQDEEVRDGLLRVEDVVDGRGQLVDVVAVERRDKRGVQRLED